MLFGASRRLRELEERIETLERLVKSRDLDWDDMRARCKRLLDRTEKAATRMQDEEPATVDVPTPKVPAGSTLLTPSPDRMQKIRDQLAARGRKAG